MVPRYLSRSGSASRRQAEQAVTEGRVRINGQVCRDVLRLVTPGRDRVELDGRAVEPRQVGLWLAYHKPRGELCTTADPEGRPTVMRAVAHLSAALQPVGRLDMASEGLLLFTDDHLAAARLLDPRSHVEKVYRVKIRGHPSPAAMQRWTANWLEEAGLRLGPMAVQELSRAQASTWLEIRLREGKNRQIRRRMEAEGHEVQRLIRQSIGPIELAELPAGASRPLGPAESMWISNGDIP
jgi:23S rRNA pseudouridine2605 synthase